MKTVKLPRSPGAELEATTPQQGHCRGAAASASAGVWARWEAQQKTGNTYSRDCRTEGREMLPVSCKTAARTTCLCSLTTSSSSLLLSVAAGVLTLVPTSLSNLGIENTTYPKKGAPTPRLSSYSEPGKLFLAHKLTFFPFWPRSCRLGFHDILTEEIHRRARMRLHRAVTVSGLWLIQAGRTRACVSCLGSRGQVKVGRTKPVLSEVLRKSVPHFISCNLSTVTGQTVCLEQFPNFWTHILDHLVPVARALVFQEN